MLNDCVINPSSVSNLTAKSLDALGAVVIEFLDITEPPLSYQFVRLLLSSHALKSKSVTKLS